MQHYYATCLTIIAVGCLASSAMAQDYIIKSDPLNQKILDNLNLGSGNWAHKLQVEGLGIAQSLIFLLQDKYPASRESLEGLKKHKILFVGGYGGNALGGWVAAVLLGALGIQCDLYVIRDESTSIKTNGASAYSKVLLKDIVKNKPAGVNLLNTTDFDTDLDKDFGDITALIQEITNPTAGLKQTIEQVMQIALSEENTKDYATFFKEVDLRDYSLVSDGITGASQDDKDFKLGTLWALLLLKRAETVYGNILVSIDFPSLWFKGLPYLPGKYSQFGLGALFPFAIIHIGAMKPYVLNKYCSLEKMLHYVVVPKDLEDALHNKMDELLKINGVSSQDFQRIVTYPTAGSQVYLKFSYKNVVVDIKKETLDKGKLSENNVPAQALANYVQNLSAVSGFGIAVAA